MQQKIKTLTQTGSNKIYDADALIRAAFAKLNAARQQQGISLCSAAKHAGVSVYLLKSLERKPGAHCKVWLLFALSEMYGISMSSLFKHD
jgi:hypothetical protein